MKQRPFLALWTLAVIATVAAFVLHLALRGRTVDLGYKLGRARAEQARLREMKRVLSLEAASYETPQRVEMVARTLLGMTPPPAERVITIRGFWPSKEAEAERTATGAEAAMGKPSQPALPAPADGSGAAPSAPAEDTSAPAAPPSAAPELPPEVPVDPGPGADPIDLGGGAP
jgi:cell division protein FtsL